METTPTEKSSESIPFFFLLHILYLVRVNFVLRIKDCVYSDMLSLLNLSFFGILYINALPLFCVFYCFCPVVQSTCPRFPTVDFLFFSSFLVVFIFPSKYTPSWTNAFQYNFHIQINDKNLDHLIVYQD